MVKANFSQLKTQVALFFIENTAWPLFIMIYFVLGLIRPVLLSFEFMKYVIYVTVPLGFAITAQAICLIARALDLSVGSIVGLSAAVAGVILMDYPGFPAELSFFLPIVVGMLCGMFNGFFIGYLKLNPFVVTLATMMAFQGLKIIVLRGFTIPGSYLPEIYMLPGSDIGMSMLSFAIFLIIIWFFLRHTKPGIHIYGLGGNPDAAAMMGIDPRKMYFIVFTLSGVFAGLSGLYYTGFNRSVPVTLGNQILFPSFAAAVIGGIPLQGGRGSVLNVAGGALLLGIVEAFLVTFAISPEARIVGYGILVLIAVVVNQARESMRDSLLRRL
ncbi:hypothetical protein DRO64_00145 [Candidatus Bathyarchaeota archaeon]|nr:MAG: hypothetical protein DRO64_00145 [Candidatus Bathyarchaeota archaeon]